jgi:hypothetical protein
MVSGRRVRGGRGDEDGSARTGVMTMSDRNAAFEGPGPDEVFQGYLKEGKLALQRCRTAGRCFFPPRLLSPFTGTSEVEWIEVSGRGTVYTTTVIRRKPERGGDYNVAMIDLEEGGRMMSRIEGVAPTDVEIGTAVIARITEDEDGEPFVVFDPA